MFSCPGLRSLFMGVRLVQELSEPCQPPRQAYTVLIDASQREAYNARLQQHLQDALDDYTGAAAPVLAI